MEVSTDVLKNVKAGNNDRIIIKKQYTAALQTIYSGNLIE